MNDFIPATRAEIDELKRGWLADPCFDLAEAGNSAKYAAYVEELRKFEQETKKKWATDKTARLQKISERIGVPGNHLLAEYVETLERRMEDMRQKLESIRWRE